VFDEVTVGIGVENKETLRATTESALGCSVRMKLLVPFVLKADVSAHVRGYVLRAWLR